MKGNENDRKRLFDEANLLLFAKHLIAVRKKNGFTQEELSYASDITLSQIARIETARINPGLSTIFKLAKAMKVDLKELFDFQLV